MKLFTKKSNIAFIGAGKIASSLCSVLVKCGYNVSSVISKNKTSASKLAKQFNIPFYSDDLNFLSKESKIFFLTVPDSEIERTAVVISKIDLDFKNSLFIHVSGALDLSELKLLKEKKAHTASFHIMQTFPSKKLVDIKNCSVALEADEKAVKDFLGKLASNLELKSFYLKPDKKIYYHLAGVFASNFLAGNLYSSGKLFHLTGAGEKDFFTIVSSIINSTLDNVKKVGPAKALSGPVERGDYQTIEKHLKALKKKDKMLLMSYIIQSLFLINVSKDKNKKLNEGQKQIRRILMKEFNQLKKL